METLSFVQKGLPSPGLSTVVEEYVYRKIVVEKDQPIVKNMPCRHIDSIDFFLKGAYETFAFKTKKTIPFSRCAIRGPRTHKKYRITIKENFESFSVRFKPTGIHQLLSVPMHEFCDESIDATLVLPGLFHDLTERLMSCNDVQACRDIVEPYLQNMLQRKLRTSPAVAQLATSLMKPEVPNRLTEMYNELPLSSRQLERNFVKEVGISPKLFSRIIRFEKMIANKIKQPDEPWASLAYKNNYYDQMHLVKDFKHFLGINPTGFCARDFAF